MNTQTKRITKITVVVFTVVFVFAFLSSSVIYAESENIAAVRAELNAELAIDKVLNQAAAAIEADNKALTESNLPLPSQELLATTVKEVRQEAAALALGFSAQAENIKPLDQNIIAANAEVNPTNLHSEEPSKMPKTAEIELSAVAKTAAILENVNVNVMQDFQTSVAANVRESIVQKQRDILNLTATAAPVTVSVGSGLSSSTVTPSDPGIPIGGDEIEKPIGGKVKSK